MISEVLNKVWKTVGEKFKIDDEVGETEVWNWGLKYT